MGFIRNKLPVSSITVICLLLVAMWAGVVVIVPEVSEAVGPTYHSGTTSGDQNWLKTDDPHIITADFTVSTGDVLTIQEDSVVKFDQGVRLIISGSLKANGSSTKPIIFTSNESSPNIGDMDEIRFNSGSSGNFMKYCIISYASYGIRSWTSSLEAQNCNIFTSTTGIRIHSGNPKIHNNTINDTTTGIQVSLGSPDIHHNTILDTPTGISVTNTGSPKIYRNTIYKSATAAISISSSITSNIYFNNINNSAAGVSISAGASNINNNTILNCTDGISISGSGSPNTYGNFINNSTTSGIRTLGTGSPTIHDNNITNSSSGIEVSGSTAKIHDNEMYLCQRGAYLKSSSNFEFYNNTLESCQDSFYTENIATIHNCTIINSTRYNFNVVNTNNHNIYTLNMSYNDTNQVLSGCNLYKQWYLHAHVNNSLGPTSLEGAIVTISPTGASNHQYNTGITGWARWIRCTEKVFAGSSTPTNRFPHTISATANGFTTDQQTLNMNTSRTLYFSITDIAEPSSSISADDYWYNTHLVLLSYQATDNSNLNDISLFYNYSADNVSFSPATEDNSTSITDTSDSGTFYFDFTAEGEGYYTFYTLATDETSLTEAVPGSPDTMAGYDITTPVFIKFEASNITEDSLYPCTVNVTINDTLSGIGDLPEIRYKYDSTSTSWDSSYEKMTKYSRSSRNEVTFYFDIPAPTNTWDYYQGKYLAWQVKAQDIAGNIIESTVGVNTKEFIDYVDHPPSIIISKPVPNKWYNRTIVIRTVPSDNDDLDDPNYGIAKVEAQYSFDSTDGLNGTWSNWTNSSATLPPYDISWPTGALVGTDEMVWIRARSKDNGGLYSPWNTIKIKIDNEPAETSHDYDGVWRNSAFEINLAANDGAIGSGVEGIYYKINNGTAMSVELNGMPEFTEEGINNSLEYWSLDNQSNIEKHKYLYEIKLDLTKPTIENIYVTNITKQTAVSFEVLLSAEIADALSGLKDLPEFRIKFPGESSFGTWKTMSFIEGNLYQGKVDLPDNKQWLHYAGENIQFEIQCFDKGNNKATASISELVDISVSFLPVIDHDPVYTANVGEDIIITATVTDDESVSIVQLYYKEGANGTFYSSSMIRQGATDIYTGTIPKQLEPGVVYYYLKAQDNKQNVATEPFLNPEANAFAINVIYVDTDNDNLPDSWEITYFASIDIYGSADDPDNDGLTNINEFLNDTDPENGDTDGDQLPDAWEVKYGLNPNDLTGINGADGDFDGDGASNLKEFKAGTNPNDPKDKPDDGEKGDDLTAVYAGIAIIIIVIIILLLFFMFLRGRGEEGAEEGGGPGGRPGEDDGGFKLEPEGKPEEKPEKLDTIKPIAKTISLTQTMEIVKLDKGLPCSVCQGAMEIGENAVKCKCGLITHKDCATQVKECPVCTTKYDLTQKEITITAKDTKVSKPVIRREVKQEIEELISPPERAYFAYVPKLIDPAKINSFLGGYYKKRDLGITKLDKNTLNNVSLFISADAAKKMFNHCYDSGREKEVMGLIIGKTYQYKNRLLSIAKDIATSELDATEVNVRFDTFDKLFDELDNLNYDYQILGWYHSHPDYSSFMSPTDIETQRRMFKHPHQHAVVIDPIRHDIKAFTLDQANKKKVHENGYAIIDFKE